MKLTVILFWKFIFSYESRGLRDVGIAELAILVVFPNITSHHEPILSRNSKISFGNWELFARKAQWLFKWNSKTFVELVVLLGEIWVLREWAKSKMRSTLLLGSCTYLKSMYGIEGQKVERFSRFSNIL